MGGLTEGRKCIQKHELSGKHADSPRMSKGKLAWGPVSGPFPGGDPVWWEMTGVPRKVHFRFQKPILANNPVLGLSRSNNATHLHEGRGWGMDLEGPPQMFCYPRPSGHSPNTRGSLGKGAPVVTEIVFPSNLSGKGA